MGPPVSDTAYPLFVSSVASGRAWQSKPAIVHLVCFANRTLGSLQKTMWAWAKVSPADLLQTSVGFTASLLSVCSSFLEEAGVMPAPADVTNSFCDLLLSISESAKLNHEHFAGSGELAVQRMQVRRRDNACRERREGSNIGAANTPPLCRWPGSW